MTSDVTPLARTQWRGWVAWMAASLCAHATVFGLGTVPSRSGIADPSDYRAVERGISDQVHDVVGLLPAQLVGAGLFNGLRLHADAVGGGAPAQTHTFKLRMSWGHRSAAPRTFHMDLQATNARVLGVAPDNLEPGERVEGFACETRAGAGDVDGLLVEVSWADNGKPRREAQSIWRFLFDHGEPGQVRRLKDDSGFTADPPLLQVSMAPDGTRGFSIALEQLARHGAMWVPEHDVFVTRADKPVDFETHLASLQGQRVLDRVRREPESSRAEWTNRWADFGDPTRPHHGQETEWLGTRGHLIGTVARHGSLYKFGVDRWGNVRPDHASPHKFRLDLQWADGRWIGQEIVDGWPVIVTRLERNRQKLEIEQFAAPLNEPSSGPRGGVPSVFVTRVQCTGAGPLRWELRLTTESTNRHPELRELAGAPCIVDHESGAVWLRIEAEPGLQVKAHVPPDETGSPSINVEFAGNLGDGGSRGAILKLASPVVAAGDVAVLATLEFASARAGVLRYWRDWLDRGARLEVPETAVNDLFRANLWHALMLPRYRTDEHGLNRIDLPYSNFAYGQFNADWPINQAVYVDYMIHGLRGYFEVAEAEFAAMYQSQQKEDGRVGGYADWGVYSPSMLYAIGQNYLLSGDRQSFERLLPASLRALDWCLGEVARGQSSGEAPGLIVAPLNDLTSEARAWAFPNAYFVSGLDVFGHALAVYGHPRAAAVQAAAGRMRSDVTRAFAQASVQSPLVQLADGTWNNYVPCDAMTPRRLLEQWYPADIDTGPLHLARLSAIDPQGWLATAMLHDHEDNLFLNQWGMANEPVYNQQATVNLYRDEPEAAIRAFYSMMACAFSHHQLTPLEHRWAWGQYYMPPSTDGAWFELYRNLLLNEFAGGGCLFVGQAVPRAWWADAQRVSVERAPTFFGPVTLQLESAAASGSLTATVQFLSERRPQTLWVRLRHPERQALRSVSVNGVEFSGFDAKRELVRIEKPVGRTYTVVGRY